MAKLTEQEKMELQLELSQEKASLKYEETMFEINKTRAVSRIADLEAKIAKVSTKPVSETKTSKKKQLLCE